jgi:secreted trypsin-like serine protease
MTRSRSPLLTFIIVSAILAITLQSVIPETGQAKRGQQHVGTQVVYGGDVAPGQYPFVAAIGYGDPSGEFRADNQFCGGSLIAASLVLTAAHCVLGVTPEQMALVVGRTSVSSSEGQVRFVTEIIMDPAFNHDNATNDLAVLRLNEPVLGIAPIKLVGVGDTSLSTPGAPLTLVGWGDTRPKPHNGKPPLWPDVMQQAQVNVVDDDTCAREWARTGYHDNSVWHFFVCTTPGIFGSGDSGSPLFVATPSGYVQVSLVSGSYAKHHKHKNKNKNNKKNNKKKLHKVIPDYGPELSDPSSTAFLVSVGV